MQQHPGLSANSMVTRITLHAACPAGPSPDTANATPDGLQICTCCAACTPALLAPPTGGVVELLSALQTDPSHSVLSNRLTRFPTHTRTPATHGSACAQRRTDTTACETQLAGTRAGAGALAPPAGGHRRLHGSGTLHPRRSARTHETCPATFAPSRPRAGYNQWCRMANSIWK